MSKTNAYSKSRVINDVVKGLIKLGWWPSKGGRHYRLHSPDDKLTITIPGTPSDHRAELNWLSQIRRLGVPVTA